ncbi:MAG: hypothetical protein JSS47_21390, partial [Proteobacteria bacterium]|nr:hypothetical protein [Pseudomonadota bacterium]
MSIAIILFGVGVWLFQQQADLLAPGWRIGGWAALTLGLAALFRLRRGMCLSSPPSHGPVACRAIVLTAWLLALAAGFLWAAQRA